MWNPKSSYTPDRDDDTQAISEAIGAISRHLDLRLIVAFTETGRTAKLVAEERPRVPVIAFTPHAEVYRRLTLVWGVRPLLLERPARSSEELLQAVEAALTERQFAGGGDKILIVGGLPMGKAGGTNFLKIHTIATPD